MQKPDNTGDPKNPEIHNLLYEKFPELRGMLKEVGPLDFTLFMKPPYVALIGAIVGQKISFTSAREIRKKIYTKLGGTDFTPQQFMTAFPDALGNPIIRELNKFLIENPGYLGNGPDLVENIKALRGRISGIGSWTVENTLLCISSPKNGEAPDIMPSGDVFIQRRIAALPLPELGKKSKLTAREVDEISKRWSPYRGYVTWYLWRWFD